MSPKLIQFRSFLLVLCIVFHYGPILAQKAKKEKADQETFEWRYEIEVVGTGTQGTYQIKVWTYSKNPEVALEQAKKNAVHAIIFKGFSNNGRISGQKPLVSNSVVEQDKEEFFQEFFKEGGSFQKYVFLAANGAIAPGDRLKVGKNEYKIGVIVSVNVSELRKYLEVNGIIKGLDSGF